MLIGSPSSPIRKARLRALYRKQYLTPTMILGLALGKSGRGIQGTRMQITIGMTRRWVNRSTYHKFVKTTPKPRATKNSNGELELWSRLSPPPSPAAVVSDAAASLVVESAAAAALATSRAAASPTTCSTAGMVTWLADGSSELC